MLSAKPTTYVDVGGSENALVSSPLEMGIHLEMGPYLRRHAPSPLEQVTSPLNTRDTDIRSQDRLGTNLCQCVHERVGLCLRN